MFFGHIEFLDRLTAFFRHLHKKKKGVDTETILEKTWDSRYFIKQKHLSGKKLELWWTDVDLFYG